MIHIELKKENGKACDKNKVTSNSASHNASEQGFASKSVDLTVVLPTISTKLPAETINHTNWSHHISTLVLADPEFYKPGEVDMLFGAEVYFDLIIEGKISGTKQTPTLHNSVLGWIVAGRCGQCPNETESTCNLTIESQLKRFWEIEQVVIPVLTKEEQYCEQHFKENIKQDESGRFIVKLPFNERLNELGKSQHIALGSFKKVEQRLSLNSERKQQYNSFLQEYLKLGHMELTGKLNFSESVTTTGNVTICFLPHHEVIKESSSSTKLRVVFNASCPTSTRVSLNDTLMVGPNVQQDLFSILTRFRLHEIVMVADCEKMYRQVLVDENDCKFQQILWRTNSYEPVKIYKLKTVTYGTSSAPFLATRCLKQLSEDEKTRFPTACAAAGADFYVDDLLTGCHDEKTALQLQEELDQLLRSGGFKLRKWCSNSSAVLDRIPKEDKEVGSMNLDLEESKPIKTLEVAWEPKSDMFQYNSQQDNKKHFLKLRIESRIPDVPGVARRNADPDLYIHSALPDQGPK
ncbi:uncharacterized protein LOC128984578 [Macrosteles quadrilineatus]|uniref:uncharacterized protein LOC128984578 n=1 Tax=Macrosteles quadrilineatus TaxID=74068 RepID=UPI0023E1925A|nr:uncharacterized protein LOC128984578 [Macrosteles quadrilineatus]